MAGNNPTRGRRAVPVDLPPQHVTILRKNLASCLWGVRLDLRTPKGMKNPKRARREANAYRRLLAGLARGTIFVPDEFARAAIEAVAKGDDDASNYAEISANHNALHGLLDLLGGAKT